MKAEKNGWIIEGTPEEINALVQFTEPVSEPKHEKLPVHTPKSPKPAKLDWAKADALKEAGWNYSAIAEEIGATYQGVYAHFNPAKK